MIYLDKISVVASKYNKSDSTSTQPNLRIIPTTVRRVIERIQQVATIKNKHRVMYIYELQDMLKKE